MVSIFRIALVFPSVTITSCDLKRSFGVVVCLHEVDKRAAVFLGDLICRISYALGVFNVAVSLV